MDSLTPHLPVIRTGSAVVLVFDIFDCSGVDPSEYASREPQFPRMDPSPGVTLSIFSDSALSDAVVRDVLMTRINPGQYQYEYQHLSGTHPTGLYSAEVVAYHGLQAQRSQFYGIFRVVD